MEKSIPVGIPATFIPPAGIPNTGEVRSFPEFIPSIGRLLLLVLLKPPLLTKGLLVFAAPPSNSLGRSKDVEEPSPENRLKFPGADDDEDPSLGPGMESLLKSAEPKLLLKSPLPKLRLKSLPPLPRSKSEFAASAFLGKSPSRRPKSGGTLPPQLGLLLALFPPPNIFGRTFGPSNCPRGPRFIFPVKLELEATLPPKLLGGMLLLLLKLLGP